MHHQQARILSQPTLPLHQALVRLARRLESEHEAQEDRLRITLAGGVIDLQGARLSLQAKDSRSLFSLQQIILHQASQEDVGVQLAWDHVDEGALPPNFSPARVMGVERISPHYTRVKLGLGDLDRFGPDSLHFRLVISAQAAGQLTQGSILQMPRIGASGAVAWPEGDLALHRPVYTLTEINHAEGWLSFDIFRHEGGRVTCWSDLARPGDQIGVMGPTQMRRDLGPWVGFYGDETALPAIRIYLASLPADAQGEAVITLQDPRDAQPLIHPEGVTLRYLPASPDALCAAVKAAPFAPDHGFLYAGCERQAADAIRAHARDHLGLSKTQMNITSFWTAP